MVSHLDEAVVERQIMPDGVPPAWASGPEVVIVVEDPLVDVAQHQLLVLGAEDGHGNQPDVRMVWFGLLVHESGAGVVFTLKPKKVYTLFSNRAK